MERLVKDAVWEKWGVDSRDGEAPGNERSVIGNEDDEAVRARVSREEERVLRGDWTERCSSDLDGDLGAAPARVRREGHLGSLRRADQAAVRRHCRHLPPQLRNDREIARQFGRLDVHQLKRTSSIFQHTHTDIQLLAGYRNYSSQLFVNKPYICTRVRLISFLAF